MDDTGICQDQFHFRVLYVHLLVKKRFLFLGTSLFFNMTNLSLLIVCLTTGYLLRVYQIIEKGNSVLNKIIIYFFIPVISILYIPNIHLSAELLWLTVSPFIIFLGSYVFFNLTQSITKFGRDTNRVLILTSGIGSTSFVGFPLFELFYGAEGLAYGVFLSLGGTILVFNTIGMSLLFSYVSTDKNYLAILKKMFKFFPFIVFLIALTLNILGFRIEGELESVLKKLSSPFSVIALIAIGSQMYISDILVYRWELLAGQIYKLLIAPLMIYILLWEVCDIKTVISAVCILGAAIGSMNAMSILTAERGIEPRLASLMPAVGIPLSIPVVIILNDSILMT
jgi:Predicted permeases